MVDTSFQSGAVTVQVSNTAELMKAIADHPNVIIQLESGNYGDVDLSGVGKDGGVTITALDHDKPPVIETLDVTNSANVVVDGVQFRPDPAPGEFSLLFAVDVRGSENVTVENSLFHGGSDGYNLDVRGIEVRGSDDVAVLNNDFTMLRRGGLFVNTDGLTVSYNTAVNNMSDGFQFNGVQNVQIERNYFSDSHPEAQNHPDYIQFFTKGGTEATENVVINENVFMQGDGGWSQSIFMDNDDHIRYSNITITNNLSYQSAPNGMVIDQVDGLVFNDNVTIGVPGAQYNASIRVFNATDYSVENNISNVLNINGVRNPDGHGNLIADLDGGGAHLGYIQYEDLFANADAGAKATIKDLMVLAGVDAGPNTDFPWVIKMLENSDWIPDETGSTGDGSATGGDGNDGSTTGGDGNDGSTTGGDGNDGSTTGGDGNDGSTTGGDGNDGSATGGGGDDGSATGGSSFNNEKALLNGLGHDFGHEPVNLGQDDGYFGSDDLSLGATFKLDSLDGGSQRLLWSQKSYGIEVKDDDLSLVFWGQDGTRNSFQFKDAIKNTGWHDVQVVLDDKADTLTTYLDGHELGAANYTGGVSNGGWNVLAGGMMNGRHGVDGSIADVSVVQEAHVPDADLSVYERTADLDSHDMHNHMPIDLSLDAG